MDIEERFKQNMFEGDWLNKSINWISENLLPDQVFNSNQLHVWARGEGLDILSTRKLKIEGMIKLMCDPENQPHQFIGDEDLAYDEMFFK